MPSRRRTLDLEPHTTLALAEAQADTGRSWAFDALCSSVDPELFFPLGNDPGTEARQICAGCPVQDLCLAYSVIAAEPFGIWGGFDHEERHALRRRLQRRGELLPATADNVA